MGSKLYGLCDRRTALINQTFNAELELDFILVPLRLITCFILHNQ